MVISVAGLIDAESKDEFQKTLQQVIDDLGQRRIILSVAELRYINSAGFGVLLNCMKKVSPQGYIRLVGVQEAVSRTIRMMGLTSVLKNYDSLEEALADEGSGGPLPE